jgi:SSS family solute:Na+ symporter
VVTTFVLEVDIHFIHIWGIEFLLNVGIMFLFSYLYPAKKSFEMKNVKAVDLQGWKYTNAMSVALVVITVAIYILLGSV